MKIYVASSWRNQIQQDVVARLMREGFDVYDFKHPEPGNPGFSWSAIDPNWKQWTPEQFKAGLEHPIADAGYNLDMNALSACDTCVLVNTSGRSAHTELGFACGAGKFTVLLLAAGDEPELMYKMANKICLDLDSVVNELNEVRRTQQAAERDMTAAAMDIAPHLWRKKA